MRRNLLTILTAALVISCTQHNQFTIKGAVDSSFYGDSIYVCNLFDTDTIATGLFIDSTSFIIQGKINESVPVYLTSSNKSTTAFVLEKGKMKMEEINDELFLVLGTSLNEVYSKFLKENENEPADTLYSRMKGLMIEHSSDALGSLLGRRLAYMVDAEEYVRLYDQMDSHMRNEPFFEKLYKRSSRSIMSHGAMFSEIIGEVDDKPARLSDYAGRGSWTLLSFWASWCGDCAREMPKLRKMYETLKDKNIQFVGIDNNDVPENMKKAIEKYDIVWPVISNTNRLESYSYGIVTIPTFILIDPDGVIVADGTDCDEFIGTIYIAMARYKSQ